jgi:hypothetical protein
MSERVLLLLPATSYRDEAFVAAAQALDIVLELACDVPRAMARHGLATHAVAFAAPDESCARLREAIVASGRGPFDAVVAADEQSAVLAAYVGMDASLCRRRYHTPAGVEAARDKVVMRKRLTVAGLAQPDYVVLQPGKAEPGKVEPSERSFPCVVKPAMLSGSQGVIRADDIEERARAIDRVRRIQRTADTPQAGVKGFDNILIERFIAGPEIVVEGLVADRDQQLQLEPLAIFDKPDPLQGPYFEESLYVTPSRHPQAVQDAAVTLTCDVARVLGLTRGPVHAEIRLSPDGPVLIEIAARSIGGLCSQVFAKLLGSLEQRILASLLDRRCAAYEPQAESAGVMMIPIPRSGVLSSVSGVEQARAVAGIDGLQMAARPGDTVRAQPEGNRYLGFIFASGTSPSEVERSLREAHACLTIQLKPLLAIA